MHKFFDFLYFISLKKSKLVFFQNLRDLNYFLKEKIVNCKQTKILPGSGIDLKKFDNKNKFVKANKTYKFLMVSRLLWSKGIQQYYDAAYLIKKNIKMLILIF